MPDPECRGSVVFVGSPADDVTPDHVDWLGYRFPRGEPVIVTDADHLRRLRANWHFQVTEVPRAQPASPSTLRLQPRPQSGRTPERASR